MIAPWLDVYDPEWGDEPDEVSGGLKVRRWTSNAAVNRHLYFTSPSVTDDLRWLVVLSERDEGNPNLFALDRLDGKLHRLTRNTQGTLQSYVYPSSNRKGLSKAAPALCAKTGCVYGIEGKEVFEVDIVSKTRRQIFDLPENWWTGYTDASPDGTKLCVPAVPPEAYTPEMKTQWDQLATTYERMQDAGLHTRLYEYDLRNNAVRVLVELPFWCTHVGYAPDGTGDLIACAEGGTPSQGGAVPRIWKVSSHGEFSPLFEQPKNRTVCHENWHPTRREIVYHGKESDGRRFMESRNWDGSVTGYVLLSEDIPVAHTTIAGNGRVLYSDTRDGRIIRSELSENTWNHKELLAVGQEEDWLRNQDNHFHPRLSPDQKLLVFSARSANRLNVYEAQLKSVS